MYGEFLKDGCRRRDRVGSAEKRPARFLRSGDETPGQSLVTGYIPVYSFFLNVRDDGVGVGDRLDVRGIVVAVIHHLAVRLDHLRMLLGEASLKIGIDIVQRTAVDKAGHSEGEHIPTFVDGDHVKPAVLEAFLCQLCDRGDDDVPVLDAKLFERIAREARFRQAEIIEGILVYKHGSVSFQPLGVRLQGGWVHRHQHVTEVPGGVYLMAADVNLESRHTGDSPFRGSDLCRIVRECGKAVTIDCGQVGEQSSGKLHTVTRIPGEPYHNILSINNLMLHFYFKNISVL